MSKVKLFIENLLIYGFGGIISKIIPFIMLPIVTSIMPSSDYYGISDLSNTVTQFGNAIAIMGMYDAMYRMFFEKDNEDYKKSVCSTALLFTFFTSFIVFVVMLACRNLIADYFFGDRRYAFVVYFSAMATFVGATNSIISAPIRMQNKRGIYIIANTVGPLLSYSISIPMLLAGYYIVALPLAAVVSGLTVEIAFGVMNRHWFSLKRFDIRLLKQLLIIAVPLLPNFLIYWIFSSCDKVMITNILGVGASGIYSVGSKIGQASQLLYMAFAGGWQYFAFSTMKEDNQVESNSKIFEYLGIVSFVITAFVCAWSFGLFKLLFKEEYLEGYIVTPYLFLSPLLLMLFQVSANQFLVVKKTWPNMLILFSGAILNVIFNIVLIPALGIEGASIATLIGYVVSDVVCVVVLYRMRLMVVSRRFVIATVIMLGFMFVWRLLFSSNVLIGTIVAILISTMMAFLYREELKKIVTLIRRRKEKA